MPTIQSVTVYCSSSQDVAQAYFDTAAELGRAIAALFMAATIAGAWALADAARAGGGKVVGITPQLLVDHGIADEQCDELIVTPSMRERKALLESRGDAFITLPGGLGTLEEIFEIIVGKTLGYHAKPIVLLNVAGFYDPLLSMIGHGIEQKFIRPKVRNLLHVSSTVEEAIAHLRRVL